MSYLCFADLEKAVEAAKLKTQAQIEARDEYIAKLTRLVDGEAFYHGHCGPYKKAIADADKKARGE